MGRSLTGVPMTGETTTGVATPLPSVAADENGIAAAGMAKVATTREFAVREPSEPEPSGTASTQATDIQGPQSDHGVLQLAETAEADPTVGVEHPDEAAQPPETVTAIPGEQPVPDEPEASPRDTTNVPNQQASFTPGPGPEVLVGLSEIGPLDPTALQYRVPEYEPRRIGDDDRDRGNMDDGMTAAMVIARNDALRIQETSEGTGNQPLIGEVYEFSRELGAVGPLPHQYADDIVDGYRFAVASASVDAANGLLSNDIPAPLTITSISYLGNNDGSLGTVTDNFDAVENRMMFAAQYGGNAIWTITFDLDDGSYDFVQHHAYSHLGTPGDVLQENFSYEVTDGLGNFSSAAFTLEIADDAPATAAFDFFLIDVQDGQDGDSGVTGNLLTGGLGADNIWFDPNVGPTGTGYSAFYPVDTDGDTFPNYGASIQVFEAPDFGADGGHIYSVGFNGVTYQRIWTGTELDPASMLFVDNGIENTVPLAPYASFEQGSYATADYFGLSVLIVEDIFGNPEGTIFAGNYWDLEATGTPDPVFGTLTYRLIDGDGDITAPQEIPFQIVDAHVYFGVPAVETAQTLENLPNYLG